ncbi:hypothetical protein PG994_007073 [Apiospora phragmitis]|uniref:Uncharacterized protein n=1 Tax=Apiospora phragmitis TaxID=2905665 RepID=A0ABR1UZT3_9PEZI
MDRNFYPDASLHGDEICYITIHAFDESVGVVHCTLHQAPLHNFDGICSHRDVERIVPNYSRPTATVYGDVVEAHIRSHDDLEILSHVDCSSQRDPTYASWIPDWRTSGEERSMGLYREGASYCASNNLGVSSHPWSADRNTEKLHLTGACLDTITTLSTSFSIDSITSKGVTDTITAFQRALHCRRLAITSKGWIGLVPKEAETGDHVAVLNGADLPYILREATLDEIPGQEKRLEGTFGTGEEFLVIGCAYIHGLMHGRGLDLAELGNITFR